MSTPIDSPLRHALKRLASGSSLSPDEASRAFGAIMRGEATAAEMAGLLMALRVKGETADEVAGAAAALREAMVPLPVADAHALVDTCGTGGGVVGTLNISTAAAFVAAGAGVRIAKHGNRSFTSRSGSADVLEALGVDIALAPERAREVLDAAGIAFLFAPTYHPAMRHIGAVRRELGVPTIMNLVGPLANPAGVQRQVIGVADAARAPLIADALRQLGAVHAIVAHAEIGMDEISPRGKTFVWEVRDGRVTRWELDPATHGLAHDDLTDLAGGSPEDNAARIVGLFEGAVDGPVRSAVLLNAAAALYVSGRGWTMEESVARAADALASGRAAQALQGLRTAAPRSIAAV